MPSSLFTWLANHILWRRKLTSTSTRKRYYKLVTVLTLVWVAVCSTFILKGYFNVTFSQLLSFCSLVCRTKCCYRYLYAPLSRTNLFYNSCPWNLIRASPVLRFLPPARFCHELLYRMQQNLAGAWEQR